MTEYQQALIDEFKESVAKCDTLESLLNTGVNLFTINYIDTIVKACWPVFAARMAEIAPEDRGRLVVGVDLPAIFHASFASVGDSSPEDTLLRVQSIVETLAEGHRGERSVILATDCKESWRRVACSVFKSKRPPKPDGFAELYAETKARLQRGGFTIEVRDAMESDDILASIAFRAKLRRHTCYLAVDDKDLLQCLGSGVVCFSPRSGKHKNEEWLLKEMQLTPKQVVDYLCLVGKDDVPSANKIGDVNATKLLARCGTYQNILDSLDDLLKAKEVTPKQADSLREYSSHYLLAKKLHTKLRNLEVNW